MARNPNCEIIAIANQKGGVGKTTTAVNLATALAAINKQVLLIDMDPQGNASSGVGVDQNNRKPSVYDVLISDVSIDNATKKSTVPNLKVVPAVMDLSATDVELATQADKEFILKDALNDSDSYYDYIILDTPPSLGLLTVNAFTCATSILVPMQCEYYALEGLSHLLHTIDLVQTHLNPGLEINGVVLSMYDKRNRITREVEGEIREHLGASVYKTVIPRNVRLSEAPSHGKPAIIYDYRCPGSQAYLALVKELLRKQMQDQLEAA